MGATKTTVGRILAGSLGYRFLDLDYLIEAGAGLKVAEIYQIFGEERFRELEAKAIGSLADMENLVIAGGGGIISNSANLPLMKENGYVIHLDVSFKEISHRVLDVRSKSIPSIEQKMQKLFERRREAFFEMADIVVSSNENRVAIEIVKEIEAKLKQFVENEKKSGEELLLEAAEAEKDVFLREEAVQEEEAKTKQAPKHKKKEGVFAKLGKSIFVSEDEKKDLDIAKRDNEDAKKKIEERQLELEEERKLEELEARKLEEERVNEEKMRHSRPWKPQRLESTENVQDTESVSGGTATSEVDEAEKRRASAEAAMKRLETRSAPEKPAFKPRAKA